MSDNIIAFIIAAGFGALIYSKLGKRVGYTNSKRLWTVVIGIFVVIYPLTFITLRYMLHFK